jgi:hypothetical protein
MSTREERRRVEHELEQRGLVPPLHRQLEIRAEATAVARRAAHLRGEERKRSEALEARFKQLAIRAREGLDVTWPDE